MQIGKVPGNILKRSVTNLIGGSPVSSKDCSLLSDGTGGVLASTQVGVADSVLSPRFAVYKAANNVWAAGGELLGVQAAFLLREQVEEPELKALTRTVIKACGDCGTFLSGGHTEVCRGLTDTLVTVTAIGSTGSGLRPDISLVRPGDSIVASKWAGLEETAYIIKDARRRDMLRKRFSDRYLETIEDCDQWLTVAAEAHAASDFGVKAMHDASDGGIFGALWEMSEGSRSGIEIDLKAVPMRQEIIEISTYFGLNPYRMKSAGCLLMAADDGEGLAKALEANGIPACVIGHFTDNNDKIIHNGEDSSYMAKK